MDGQSVLREAFRQDFHDPFRIVFTLKADDKVTIGAKLGWRLQVTDSIAMHDPVTILIKQMIGD